jgi:hypothetical protein
LLKPPQALKKTTSLTGKYAINLLFEIFQPSQDSIKYELDRQLFAKKNIANFEIEIMNDFIICNAIQMK